MLVKVAVYVVLVSAALVLVTSTLIVPPLAYGLPTVIPVVAGFEGLQLKLLLLYVPPPSEEEKIVLRPVSFAEKLLGEKINPIDLLALDLNVAHVFSL